MNSPVLTFKRYELKYILSSKQTEALMEQLENYMKVDQYGLTSIASLYYDTEDYRLIRASIEKPEFKEKIRLRSYGLAKPGKPVYLELKRKAYEIVYKRRVSTTETDVEKFFSDGDSVYEDQIGKEITYFRSYYQKLIPACLIIYDRLAYYEVDGNLRLTIDFNPRYRLNDLNLSTSMEGKPLLPDGYTILEVKVQDAMPLWLTRILSSQRIYKSSFSKYGTAYMKNINNKNMEVSYV